MKKYKLFIASLVVMASLLSTTTLAGPAIKPPPRAEATAERSLSEWFFSLFDFE